MPDRPMLFLVTHRQRVPDDGQPTVRHSVPHSALIDAVDRAVAGGVTHVILREKDLPAGELETLGARLSGLTRGRASVLVNDRADVALTCGAGGVHLPEGVLDARDVRALAPGREGFLVGCSAHSLQAAERAQAEGADYVLLGNIFETASHPGRPGAGLEFLAEAAATIAPCPVVAIGGITAANAAECIRAGAAGVAVIGAILGAPDPRVAARELVAAMALA